MSRHVFPGHTGATSVALGWDRPLKTFFVQVFRLDPDEEGEETSFIWMGTDVGELSSPAAAIKIARPWANLPDDIGRTLELDRLKTSATGDGLAQTANKQWIEDNRH